MATYLGKKWQWRMFYVVTPAGLIPLSHEMRLYLNVVDGEDPGGPFNAFNVQTRAGVLVDLSVYNDTLMDLVEELYGTTANFIRCELWAAEPTSEDFVFYSTLPVGHVGSSIATNVANNGQIMTFRCQNGNSMRLQLAESVLAAGLKDPYPFTNTPSATLAGHIAGTASAVVNKRFSFPIAPINNSVEQNETYWDARNR